MHIFTRRQQGETNDASTCSQHENHINSSVQRKLWVNTFRSQPLRAMCFHNMYMYYVVWEYNVYASSNYLITFIWYLVISNGKSFKQNKIILQIQKVTRIADDLGRSCVTRELENIVMCAYLNNILFTFIDFVEIIVCVNVCITV